MKNIFFVTSLFCILVSPASDKKTEALCNAAEESDAQKVQSLLDGKADINAIDKYGKNPLGRTILRGKIDIIRLLLENKASANTGHVLPLHYALIYGNIDVIKLLFEYKANVSEELIANPCFLPDLSGNKKAATLVMEYDATFLHQLDEYHADQQAKNLLKNYYQHLQQNPPPHITAYKNGLFREICNFIPITPLAQLVTGYLLDKKSNLDLINELNQTRADETVAARDRKFNERRALLFMAHRSSYKPSCLIF